MYPSGQWEGFWVQEVWGRQPMTPFTLRFASGKVSGEGKDVVGRFTFTGEYNQSTGKILLVKQYIGRHQVFYIGMPDGEGSIQGTWHIGEFDEGPFLIRPIYQKPSGDEPIQQMG